MHELCDPCDACDFGDSEFLALRATVDNAIAKLQTAVNNQQSAREELTRQAQELDMGYGRK